MDALQFCYWLQGYFEINGIDREGLSYEELHIINDRLKLVFTKATPVNDLKHPYQAITIQPQQLWPTHWGT